MAYHIFNLAYRHDNGEHEGFAGTSMVTPGEARRKAISKAVRKCESIGNPFRLERIIESADGLTHEIYEQLREDWRISRKSATI